MMSDERLRYFNDEYDSSQEKQEFTLKGGSFLFESDKEHTQASTPTGSVVPATSKPTPVVQDNHSQDNVRNHASRSMPDYVSQIRQIIPDMNEIVAKRLIEKYQDENDVISKAVGEYFEDFSVSNPRLESGNRVNGVNANDTGSSKKRPIKYPMKGEKRYKDVTQKAVKRSRSEIQWRKFIGSLQVNAMATRPTLRPLKYGSTLDILKSSSTLSASNLYASNGRKKVSMASFVKIFDTQQNREIGRLPEDIAQIIYPLIDIDGVEFEATMVFCENKRLSIGDSFVLQLDCFLTSIIFNGPVHEEPTSSQSSKWMGPISMAETDEELRSRSRNVALLSLFNKLHLRTIDDSKCDNDAITVDSDDDDVEIIDLNEDEDEDRDSRSEDIALEKDSQSSHQEEDTLNLNQLKVLYKTSQSLESLKDMPETELPYTASTFCLRKYQKQGLTWMLRREHEFEKAANSEELKFDTNMMNPLWKCFKWPKDMSWRSRRVEDLENMNTDMGKIFYANLHTGQFRLEKPVLKTMMKGGILSDEMGLGKTISALSLIFTSPYDSSIVDKHLFTNNDEHRNSSFPSCQSSEKPYAAKTTLVIVPTSLLSQWHSEFTKFNNSPDFYCEVYYGGNVSSLKALLTRNKKPPIVVLTTYGIVQNEWTRMLNRNGKTVVDSNDGLFSLEFYRVILDEGHVIRNRTTSTSKAAMDIAGRCRWVLTGTPIINRLDDLYSILKFLKLEPWAQISYWKMFVSYPFERKDYKQAFDVVNAILEPVLLRRTKQMRDTDGKPLVELPPKEIVVEKLKFNEIQNDVYKHYLSEAETSVKKGLAGGDLLKKYSTILVHILRLRQVCCDVRLLGGQDENDEDLSKPTRLFSESVDVKNICENIGLKLDSHRLNLIKAVILEKHPTADSVKKLECSICTADPIEPCRILFTECCHAFCRDCLKEYLKFQEQKAMELKCPNCRQPINKDYLFTLEFRDGKTNAVPLSETTKSTKIEALLNHCDLLQQTSPGEQIVVFSQFSSFLDILESELSNAFRGKEVKIYKFDGRLNLKERASVLHDFSIKDFENQKILLMSLRTGGVGLNLTYASHAFMMDPWWSPSMEDQAIDRIHRIGQINRVKVTRFIVENSIEEKMLKIQDRKRTIGEVMDDDEEERRKRRIDEIKMLFE